MAQFTGNKMNFTQQLIFFCLWFGTGVLSLSYIYTAIFKSSSNNPVFMKQVFGLVSIFVLYILYKAYQSGVLKNDFLVGIKIVLLSWLPYFIVLIGYLILAKVQGRL